MAWACSIPLWWWSGPCIGSGIFIVPAEMARHIGIAGWLLVAWGVAGILTIARALCYGELSAMMPQAGGMYVYLREAYSPLWSFLYGWTLFSVIETGTIAAVAVAFARFSGVLWPLISEDKYLIAPFRLSSHYALSLATAQLLAIGVIALLTFSNTLGLRYGKLIQNVFTIAKTGALGGLIVLGILLGRNASALHANFSSPWHAPGINSLGRGLTAATMSGLLITICLSQTGSLFSADSWHNIAFAAAEGKNPERNVTLAMVIGATVVIGFMFWQTSRIWSRSLWRQSSMRRQIGWGPRRCGRSFRVLGLRSWRLPSWSRPSARSTPSP